MSLYLHDLAKDNCGFGLIAQLDGVKSYSLIEKSLSALTRMTHRGAVHQDGLSGDGCGVSIQLDKEFFTQIAREMNFTVGENFAVGQVFFSQDPQKAQECKLILEEELVRETLQIAGWRKVPTDEAYCGEIAARSMPTIEQVFVNAPSGWRQFDLERRLFMARRRAAERIVDPDYYVVSLSTLNIIYKALVMPQHLKDFYLDLKDQRMRSAISIFHQRFSTNTQPLWKFAQPFRFLAHNGEINTISGNRRWSIARQKKLYTPLLPDLSSLTQLVNQSGSDSSSLDNMLEVMLAGGMDIFRALRLLVPPAWEKRQNMDAELRAFYEFNSMHAEPWDGPAGIVMTNGQQIACTIDRNGLRPARYVITQDRLLTVASEVGVWDYKESDVIEKDRVGPGEMLAADTSTGQIWRTNQIDDMLKSRHPYLEWLRENTIRLRSNIELERQGADNYIEESIHTLSTYEKFFGVSAEEKEQIIRVMANQTQEPIGSMGDDTPIAVLSEKSRSLFDYFRQQFAQVTNPPIDPLREKAVMSLETCFGREHNVFQETNGLASRAIIGKPVLNYAKLQQLLALDQNNYQHQSLSLAYSKSVSLASAIQTLADSAVELVKRGCVILRLTDRAIQQDQLMIHAALATGAVHNRLIDEGLRCDANIIVETATARDPHHFAVLIGVGATAIYPYLSLQIINKLHLDGLLNYDLIRARKNYLKAINKGLLKIISKMGISTIASYRGAQLFELVGISSQVSALCFPGITNRIEGACFDEIKRASDICAQKAWLPAKRIERSGQLKYVHGGEYHCYNPDVVSLLQKAVLSEDFSDYRKYANAVNHRPVAALRDLLTFKLQNKSLDLEQVEPEASIIKRFDSAGMSIGALSPEAHESLAIAMNTIGRRSNSGEGGEDYSRFDSIKNSKIKQVASGRFGVTAQYLRSAEVIQIKIAQGAKPGEGGQLPGDKVTLEIAKLRHSTPGVTLISPPPHHDIYSIEDLAQLIFDLKQVSPQALISVKLVSGPGVGTIAAGVAKAYADMITIAGHDGGTGASPLTSVKYAGTPWELGLAEAHQALIENGLRDRICLQVDGGLKTGLDVIKGAILGADSFGFGTGPMVALGCKYLRICHLNNCATGIATQNKTLRDNHFHGLPDKVIQYFRFVARETRYWLAKLGVAQIDQLIGRTDLLSKIQGYTEQQRRLNLSVILKAAQRPKSKQAHYQGLKNQPFDQGVLNQKLLADYLKTIETSDQQINGVNHHNQMNAQEGEHAVYQIKNYDRSVGASVAGHMASLLNQMQKSNQMPNAMHRLNAIKGQNDLPQFVAQFKGVAGQSFGVWNCNGMHLSLQGDANDYVAKGMSGGKIAIFPPKNIRYVASRGAIIGNTCLYGATGGQLFAAGQAGERFAVRNSGAVAVVEGLGDHGCEYMTGGTIVVLGPVGENFAAGMTGGTAIILDLRETLSRRLNFEHIEVLKLTDPECDSYVEELKSLLAQHVTHTQSPWATKISNNLPQYLDYFSVVVPKASGQAFHSQVQLRVVK